MTDSPEPTARDHPASFSGPTDGLEPPLRPTPDAAVERARHALRIIGIVCAVASVAVTVSLVIAPGVMGDNEPWLLALHSNPGVLLWILSAPALITLAINAFAWRPFVSTLNAAPIGRRVLAIVGVGALWSAASVVLVVLLVFAGYGVLGAIVRG